MSGSSISTLSVSTTAVHQFVDITDLIQEWAPDLLKRWSSTAWEYFMVEKGQYLAVPTPRTTPTDVQYLHIRRDWLDKIDRDVPLTLEELLLCLSLPWVVLVAVETEKWLIRRGLIYQSGSAKELSGS